MGNEVYIPTGVNSDKNIIEIFMLIMGIFFLELEKIETIFWVPGNHKSYIYFTKDYKEVTYKSKNFHKKA